MDGLSFIDAPVPVQDYFIRILEGNDLKAAMENFSQGKGYNQEDLTCFFPVDRSEDDGLPAESYGEIEFWTYSINQEALICFEDFLGYLDQAVAARIDDKPDRGRDLRVLQGKVVLTIKELAAAHRQYQSQHRSSG